MTIVHLISGVKIMPIHPSNVPSMDGRHMSPFFFPPDYKIYLLNKRLQERPDEGDNHWWDAFATEFFEDKATFTFSFCLEDGPKRYTIGRTLIPRFFRTMFESGVVDMYFVLRFAKDYSNAGSITMDCDSTSMVMHHTKPIPTKVRIRLRYFCVTLVSNLIKGFLYTTIFERKNPSLNVPKSISTDLFNAIILRKVKNSYPYPY